MTAEAPETYAAHRRLATTTRYATGKSIARCPCGWRSPERETFAAASDDLWLHLETHRDH